MTQSAVPEATTRTCRGCGDTFSLDHLDAEARAWWLRELADFCSEDCERYHYHPEES